MKKTFQRRKPKVVWPILPVLDAFVLYSLIEKYGDQSMVAELRTPVEVAEVRGHADACLRHAEREVLHTFSALMRDFGENVSQWHPHYLMKVAKRCSPALFPEGLEVLQNLHTLANYVHVPPVRTGVHAIALERWHVLGDRAAAIVSISHDDFPDDPSDWNKPTWKAYFRRFPQELFSLTILASVAELASLEPHAFTDRERWVYKRFLPDNTWRPEHVYWDEYDEFPGDEEDDEQREPWQ